ncbi:AI-2E family transporter [Thalassobacillus sp. CUG 92003]|uniref:AI-2E family transporter n=1 Tax=Thalassobacillus sp. CUG 92003 TaxID=2736641 RepID=UPI0015E77816|nr:AI-2E family transporter [Thalassobacillus sp. CUG 92003]
MDSQTKKRLRQLAFVILFLLALFLLALLYPYVEPFIVIIGTVLIPFVVAGFLSFLLHPLIKGFEDLNIPRPLAIVLVFVLFFFLVGMGIYRGYPRIVEQLKELNEHLPQLVEAYQHWTRELYHQTERFPDGFKEQLDGMFQSFETWLSDMIMAVVSSMSNIMELVILAAVVPVVTFYLLKDYKHLGGVALRLLPKRFHHEALKLTKKLNHSLGGYIRGQLLISLFVGVLAFLGFWLIDLDYSLLLGLIAGITNIIPYFGPILGAVPAIVFALTISTTKLIYVLIIVVVIQVIEGNLLSPYIMGKSIHIHPLFIIFALLAGGELGGIAGMILAVPVLTCLKVIAEEIWQHRTEH